VDITNVNNIIDTKLVKKSGDTLTGTLNINNIDSNTFINIGNNANIINIGN
jgi:hypothetical protein